VTFLASGGDRFTLLNVTTWVLSVALWLAACWQGTGSPFWARPQERLREAWAAGRTGAARWLREGVTLRMSWTALALGAVLLFGVGMLFYRIGDVPAEMTSDHAEKLLDVRDVLDGQHRIFFPRNTGREAVQFYLIAAMTPLTGLTYLTMKLGTAAVAACTLPFTFLLARVFWPARFALLATLVLGTTRWLWQVARVGLRFPFPPAFGAAITFFLLRAIRDRRRSDFLLCGLALGLAQHTYTTLRLAPLAVLACLGIALGVDVWRREPPGRVYRLVLDTGLLLVTALLVFVPLGRYAADAPQSFFYRAVTRLASDTRDAVPPNAALVFLGNVKNSLLMFNWRGDLVWVNTIPGAPLLDPLSGALLVLGGAYALYRLGRYRELPYAYLLVLLFMGLLPSMLSIAYPGENPSTVRSGFALPVTAVLVALPLALLATRLAGWVGGGPGRVAAGVALAALLVPMWRLNVDEYFRVYAAQHARSSQHTTAVAGAVNGFLALGGRREDVYVLPGAYWFDTRLVAIQAGDIRWDPLIPDVQAARTADGVPRPRLYIVKPDDQATLDQLARWYPTSIREVHALADADGLPYFVTVLVPPGAVAQG
jgi:hypothetical protein